LGEKVTARAKSSRTHVAAARRAFVGCDLPRDCLSLDFARTVAAFCTGGSNRNPLTRTDPDPTAGDQRQARHCQVVQRHYASRHGGDSSRRGRDDRAGRSAKLRCRSEIAGAPAVAEQDDRGIGEDQPAIADVDARIASDVIARSGLAALRAALPNESENASGESCPTRFASLATQFLRLPDRAAIAASAESSQSAPASGGDG